MKHESCCALLNTSTLLFVLSQVNPVHTYYHWRGVSVTFVNRCGNFSLNNTFFLISVYIWTYSQCILPLARLLQETFQTTPVAYKVDKKQSVATTLVFVLELIYVC